MSLDINVVSLESRDEHTTEVQVLNPTWEGDLLKVTIDPVEVFCNMVANCYDYGADIESIQQMDTSILEAVSDLINEVQTKLHNRLRNKEQAMTATTTTTTTMTRVQEEWGDAHMSDIDDLTPRQQQIIDYLVSGNHPEELAIMLIQHFTDQELADLEVEVDNTEDDIDFSDIDLIDPED